MSRPPKSAAPAALPAVSVPRSTRRSPSPLRPLTPHLHINPLTLHRKTLGAIAEHLFTACCLSLGFTVSKPVLENSRYDLVLDLSTVPSLDPCPLSAPSVSAASRHPRCELSAPCSLFSSHSSCGFSPRLVRVQVKSAWTLTRGRWGAGRYQIATGCGPRLKRRYTTQDIDFLAAYLAPLEIAASGALTRNSKLETRNCPTALAAGAWYIIPAHEITHCLSLYFSPKPTTSRLMHYRDRWDLLLG